MKPPCIHRLIRSEMTSQGPYNCRKYRTMVRMCPLNCRGYKSAKPKQEPLL